MGKLIIDHDDDISPLDAILKVLAVVNGGKVSEAAGVPHYCWATAFDNDVMVYTRRKKVGQDSDSFNVIKDAE